LQLCDQSTIPWKEFLAATMDKKLALREDKVQLVFDHFCLCHHHHAQSHTSTNTNTKTSSTLGPPESMNGQGEKGTSLSSTNPPTTHTDEPPP